MIDYLKCAAVFAAMTMSALAVELKNGAEFTLNEAPEELTVQLRRGSSIRFLLEENATTGFQWSAAYASNECSVAIEHRPANAKNGVCGAPGKAAFTVTKNAAVQSPSLVEFTYRRSWEKADGAKRVRLILYTIPGEAVDFRYPPSRVLNMLKAECQNRGIELIDWHVHIRGGLTPAMAAEREQACGIRQSAMENHGREWEIFDNARLAAFADRARQAKVNGHTLPVGIQVNDRDWFRQIDAATCAKFDYILADTMIMGKLPNGRDKRLWLVKDLSEIGDPEKWMDEYVAMNLQILGEPISILANPGYLPAPLDGMHDRLWTEARMRKVIAKAVERGIAIEIQAESPYPSVRFLKLAKAMGAKFSFGTNNYDAAPKNLSRWLEAIVWLDLKRDDIWTPKCLKQGTLNRYAFDAGAGAPKLFYDAFQTIEQGSQAEVAIVFIHGWGGRVDAVLPVFNAALIKRAGSKELAPPVFAPQFPRRETMERNKEPNDGRAVWCDSWAEEEKHPTEFGLAADDWRGGGDANGTKFSSYEYIDAIFARLADRTKYPRLRKVVLAGFSAGGQFAGRYAATGKGFVRDDAKVVYVAMAPSTEFRFDVDQPWLYGLKGRPRYSAALTNDEIMRNLCSRRVWRGCGSEDTLGRPYTSLDVTPPAISQGANRFERFKSFQKYLEKYPKWQQQVSFHVFEGIGHKETICYPAPALLDFIFE